MNDPANEPQKQKLEMPKYTCNKQVHAVQIHDIVGGVLVFESKDDAKMEMPMEWMKQYHPTPGGYFIIHDDGMQSYLSKEAFEGWYTSNKPDKPKVVVMCGSSRFCDIMAVVEWMIERDELAITMGLNLLPHWYDRDLTDHLAEHEGCADEMDELHLRKIDMADEIFVLDESLEPGGEPYIGESTSREIAYAESVGVHVRRYSQDPFIRNAVRARIQKFVEDSVKTTAE